jgi:hypothetical protein
MLLGMVLLATHAIYAQPTITNVYVSTSTATTATIVWTTNVGATSQVRYGFDTSLQYSNPANPALVTSHSMTLTNLANTRPYYFAVVSANSFNVSAQSATMQFSLCSSGVVPVVGTVNNYYEYGSYTLTWVPPTGASGTPMLCGVPLTTPVTGSLSGGGSFSASVGDSFQVTPGPGSWQVAVTDAGNLSPISVNIAISTQTNDISAYLKAAASTAGLTGVLANTNNNTVYPPFVSGSSGAVVTNPTTSQEIIQPQATEFVKSITNPLAYTSVIPNYGAMDVTYCVDNFVPDWQDFAAGGSAQMPRYCNTNAFDSNTPGFNLGSWPSPFPAGEQLTAGRNDTYSFHDQGIVTGLQQKTTTSGVGDEQGLNIVLIAAAGAVAPASEGTENVRIDLEEQGQIYTAPVDTSGSNPPAGLGATTVFTDCSNCAASNYVGPNILQGVGQYLMETASYNSNVATAITNAESGYMPSTVTLLTPLASGQVSTAWGITTSACFVTQTEANTGTPCSFSVSVTSGTFVANALVEATGYYHNQAVITTASSISGGVQNITMTAHHSIPIGAYIYQGNAYSAGGSCTGTGLEFTANTINGITYLYDVVGCTDTTHLKVVYYATTGSQIFIDPGNVYMNSEAVTSPATASATNTILLTPGAQPLYNQIYAGGQTITIANSTHFNGLCTNTTLVNSGNQLQCTQTATAGTTDSGATATFTVGTTGYGNSSINLHRMAEILDIRNPTTHLSDGTLILEANEMPLTNGTSVTQTHLISQGYTTISAVQATHSPYRATNNNGFVHAFYNMLGAPTSQNGFNTAGFTSNNYTPLSQYVGSGGTQYPGEGLLLNGPHMTGLHMIYAPYPSGTAAVESVGCPETGCGDGNYTYFLRELEGNLGRYSEIFTPSQSLLTTQLYNDNNATVSTFGPSGFHWLVNTAAGPNPAGQLDINSSGVTANKFIISALTAGTAAICANGTGGQLTNNGTCAVATTPATTSLLKGNGTANGVVAAVAGTDYEPAIDVNPINFSGYYCNAVETPVSLNGEYQYSTATGTDGTTALASAIAAASRGMPAVPIGAAAEAEAHTTFQRTIRFPDGCGILISSFPTIPDGVLLEGNNVSFYITATSGNGPLFVSTDAGSPATSGTWNEQIKNLRVVYVGTPGTHTGICAGFIQGGTSTIDNVSTFGCHIGIAVAGTEYSTITHNKSAHNDIGIALLPASFATIGPNVPAAISKTGTPSINNVVIDNTSRNNKINYWLNGATTNIIYAGSASFGYMADIVLGAADFTYVNNLTISGGSTEVCTANATIPLTLTGGSPTLPASAAFMTDSSGHAIGVSTSGSNLIIPSDQGGKGYATAPTVTVPTGTPGCSTPPTITASITSLSGLPFSGEATAGSAQNEIVSFNAENESVDANGNLNRPSTGFQVILGTSANDTVVRRMVNGVDGSGYGNAFFMRSEALNNIVYDSLLVPTVDLASGSICPYMETQGLEVHFVGKVTAPESEVCGSNSLPDYSYAVKFIGWDSNLLKAHGFSGVGQASGDGSSDTLVQGSEPGDAVKRFIAAMDGTASYSSGSVAYDVQTKRTGTTLWGGTWGVSTGSYGNAPWYVASNEGVPQGFFRFVSSNATATYPNISSSGIPTNSLCEATVQWNGTGSGVTAAYGGLASCNDGQGDGDIIYQATGTLNTMTWISGLVAVNSLKTSQTTQPTIGSTCYAANQFLFSQVPSIIYCNGNPGVWVAVSPTIIMSTATFDSSTTATTGSLSGTYHSVPAITCSDNTAVVAVRCVGTLSGTTLTINFTELVSSSNTVSYSTVSGN